MSTHSLVLTLRIATGKWIARVAALAGTDGRVIHHITVGIEATRAGTRILAAFIDAGQVGRTLRVLSALGATIGSTSNVVGQARADTRLANDATLRVRSTGTGHTGILIELGLFGLLLPGCTTHEGITTVAGGARADRIVVGDLANSLIAAGTGTWVYTTQIHTCPVLAALGANRALRTTGGRSTNVIGNARADRMAVNLAALTVRTTRRWLAGLHRWCH